MPPEQNKRAHSVLLEGKDYFNVQFMEPMPSNAAYNDFLNSNDVVIGMSGGEGWGLPEFQSVCLGKHAIILNCNGYQSWANEDNSILVEPSRKIKAEDGVFFHKNGPYNQGNIYDFEENDFLEACDQSIERHRENKVNQKGEELKENFSYSKTFDSLMNHLQEIE